jgi:hypothetical protein
MSGGNVFERQANLRLPLSPDQRMAVTTAVQRLLTEI